MLEVECDNDAFADSEFYPELARIIRETAGRLMDGDLLVADDEGEERRVLDRNGNRVGCFRFVQ